MRMYGGNGRGCRHRRRNSAADVQGRGRGRCFRDDPATSMPGTVDEPGQPDPEAQGFDSEDEMRMLEEAEQSLTKEMDDLTMIIDKLKKNKEVNE